LTLPQKSRRREQNFAISEISVLMSWIVASAMALFLSHSTGNPVRNMNPFVDVTMKSIINGFAGLFIIIGLVAMTVTKTDAQNLNAASPLGFFTNVASRLLSSEMNLNLSQIEIYPTNQYTPAVHRLLQVTANVYDASTNSYFPSVFRPLFSRDQGGLGTNLYVSGYACVPSVTGPGDPQLAPPVDALALAATNIPVINMAVNVYGVPWIIGAKKGFPNFNEFVQENAVGMTRRLQLTRDLNYETNNFPKVRLTGTNQMYIFNLVSSVGLDFWNSYNSNFLDNVTVVYRGTTWMTITNDETGFDNHPGIIQPMGFSFANTNSFALWPGTFPWSPAVQNGGNGQPNFSSFFVPLYVPAYPVLTNSVYRTGNASLTPGTLPPGFSGPCLMPVNYFGSVGMTVLFETSPPGFPLPHFGLLTTNRLQVFMLDGSNGSYNVIDYANFELNSSRDLNAEIFNDDAGVPVGSTFNIGIWNTNLDTNTQVPYGIENQILISKGASGTGFANQAHGAPASEDGIWQSDPISAQYGPTIPAQQAYFLAFFFPYGHVANISDSYGQASASNIQASVIAPYAPTRFALGYTILQANDPLVHYLASDLTPSFPAVFLDLPPQFNNFYTNELIRSLNLGSLNFNYQPWSGNPMLVPETPDPNAYNLAERDPLVSQSDDWNFPNGPALNPVWLGQVHRGTPWQTIYLKASDILASGGGLTVWENWTGDWDAADATAMAPVRDWHLASLLASLFDTNSVQSLLSVNNPNPNAWAVSLNGLTAWTNTIPGEYDTLVISSNSPQALVIANDIQSARTNQPGQSFADIGDILTVPQLTEQSPFLNSGSEISDEAYEMIPSQLLPLLRVDSVGAVTPTNGQMAIQFTGSDGHAYAIEVSQDLVNWTSISTNWPAGDVINFTNPPVFDGGAQFFRSVLLQ
jgi:hypothetical protein